MKDLRAVYGSLRKGWWNHDWALGDAEFVSETKVEGYRLASNGCFPAAIETQAPRAVTVEVYDVANVDANIVDMMDGMEFNCGYVRRLVKTTDGQDVWMYVMPEERAAGYFTEDIASDDWATIEEVF